MIVARIEIMIILINFLSFNILFISLSSFHLHYSFPSCSSLPVPACRRTGADRGAFCPGIGPVCHFISMIKSSSMPLECLNPFSIRSSFLLQLHCLSLIFKVKIDTTTIPLVIILMANHSSPKCNLNIGL